MTQRACFIIAPVGASLGLLADVIAHSGWRVLNAEPAAMSLSLSGPFDMIASADAVIVVDPWASPTLLIETGYALGHGVAALLVASDKALLPSVENEPSLAMLPRVRAKLSDGTALRFHIPIFLDGVDKSLGQPRLTPPLPPLTFKANLPKVRPGAPQSALEQHLLDLFDRSDEVVAVAQDPNRPSASGPVYRPDFAIWLGDPSVTLINPVLIDVTTRLTPAQVDRKLQQVHAYALQASMGMLLLVEDTPQLPLTLVELSPMIMRIGLPALSYLLEGRQLVRALSETRNRAVHGLG